MMCNIYFNLNYYKAVLINDSHFLVTMRLLVHEWFSFHPALK
jgi:hypothetical protein